MPTLPEPTPTAPAAGQAHPTDADRAEAARLLAALDNIPTSFRDTSPLPAIGSAPPVPQPGRPPMSEKATDASVMMTAAGFLSLCLGGAVSAVLHYSGGANETVVICLCAAPPATLLALSRLLRRAKEVVEAAPVEQHHHYSGPVYQDQRNVHSSTRGVWARTDNRGQ